MGATDQNIERVIRDHGEMIARVARGYVDDPRDIDDLWQEILVALWRALPRFRGESSERTFVLRVAHNRGITHSICRRRSEPLLEPEQLPDPAPLAETRLINEQRQERLFEAVRRLPELQRQAVMLQLEGLSGREIAEIQGTTETNVGVRLTRARKALRAMLTEDDI
jgi:RNA polymerase sigma factor (sigma-70 family)